MPSLQRKQEFEDSKPKTPARPILRLSDIRGTKPEPDVKPAEPDPKPRKIPRCVRNPKNLTDWTRVLYFYWPKTFNWNKPRPLKVGIKQDLLDTGKIPWYVVGPLLNKYTNRIVYQDSVRVGRVRIDLEGKHCGKVTQGQADWVPGKKKKIHKEMEKRKEQSSTDV